MLLIIFCLTTHVGTDVTVTGNRQSDEDPWTITIETSEFFGVVQDSSELRGVQTAQVKTIEKRTKTGRHFKYGVEFTTYNGVASAKLDGGMRRKVWAQEVVDELNARLSTSATTFTYDYSSAEWFEQSFYMFAGAVVFVVGLYRVTTFNG